MFGLAAGRRIDWVSRHAHERGCNLDFTINVHPDAHSVDELMEAIRAVVDVPKAPLAAVKELLPFALDGSRSSA